MLEWWSRSRQRSSVGGTDCLAVNLKSRAHHSCQQPRGQPKPSQEQWGLIPPVGTRQRMEPDHLRDPEDFEPGRLRQGWQHEASRRVKERHREELFSRVSDLERVLIRSQAGPGAGAAFTALLTGSETAIPSHLFRVVLLRRLRQHLPLSERSCRCGRFLDVFGHIVQFALGLDVGSQRILPRDRHSEDLQGSERACADECVHWGHGSGNAWCSGRTET